MIAKLVWCMILPGIQELFVAFFTLACFYHIEYIDLNVNENENMKQEIFSLVSISFQPLMLSTSLLNCLPALLYFRSHFLYLDLLVFFSFFEFLCNVSYFEEWKYLCCRREFVFSKTSQLFCVSVVFFWTSRIVPSPNSHSYCGENKNWLYKQSLRASHHS